MLRCMKNNLGNNCKIFFTVAAMKGFLYWEIEEALNAKRILVDTNVGIQSTNMGKN